MKILVTGGMGFIGSLQNLDNDHRYILDYQKIKNERRFTPSMSFENGILETINWYKQNQDWVDYALTKDK